MRSDRILCAAAVTLALLGQSCRDVVRPKQAEKEAAWLAFSVLVIDDTTSNEQFYQGSAEVIVFDEDRPLDSDGYSSASLQTAGPVELSVPEPGLYDIAMLSTQGRFYSVGLQNFVVEDVHLPADLELRSPDPLVGGRVQLPSNLPADAHEYSKVRFGFEISGLPSRFNGHFTQDTALAADGSFALRAAPGDYEVQFTLNNAALELLYTWEGMLALSEQQSLDLMMPLHPVDIDYSTHPGIPTDTLFRVRSNLGTRGTARVSSKIIRLDEFPVSIWGLEGWSTILVTSVNVPVQRSRTWIQLPQQAPLVIVEDRVRLSVDFVDEDGSPVEMVFIQIIGPAYSTGRFSDGEGNVTVFLEPNTYRLQIGDQARELLDVFSDTDIRRTVAIQP